MLVDPLFEEHAGYENFAMGQQRPGINHQSLEQRIDFFAAETVPLGLWPFVLTLKQFGQLGHRPYLLFIRLM
jgi:hypothetical protein